ncbi:hypothetical protein CAC42_8064 [Sphaceloma murrayae]|uniref:Transcription factor domain-containing protein n=1 Tax=Sphaceloma murrayae TaxID=2082308 RepID=A0A2K1QR62_9PEZI|nr:hypothetical protein CAC42_8064 [Sphaceloma murrayae]
MDSDFDFAVHQRYLDDFFAHAHIKNPVLKESHIRNRLRAISLNGIGWNAESCLLLVILAIGALSQPFGSAPDHKCDSEYRAAQSLYAAAQKRVGSLIHADYLIQAQCAMFSGVYLMSVLQPFNAWRMFINGLTLCQAFESLRDTAKDGTTQSATQAEESVYWSCWKSERELRLELRLPDFTTAGLDHPQMFPSLPQGCEGDSMRAWYFYLAEISIWRIETSIRKDLAGLDSSISMEELASRMEALEEPVTSWKASLPPVISLSEDIADTERDVLRFVLRGRLTYNYELFTWPFVRAAILGQLPSGPLATRAAIKGLQTHYDRLFINRPGFAYRHHGTWLMQRSSARSGCILIAAATTLPSDWLPNDWAPMVWRTISMLDNWRHNVAGLGDIADLMRATMSRLNV